MTAPTADDIETAALLIAEHGDTSTALTVLVTYGLYGWDRERARAAVEAARPLARTLINR